MKSDIEFAKCNAVPCIVRISFILHFACVYGRHKCNITQMHIAEDCPWSEYEQ